MACHFFLTDEETESQKWSRVESGRTWIQTHFSLLCSIMYWLHCFTYRLESCLNDIFSNFKLFVLMLFLIDLSPRYLIRNQILLMPLLDYRYLSLMTRIAYSFEVFSVLKKIRQGTFWVLESQINHSALIMIN